jgi:hypothetical protein
VNPNDAARLLAVAAAFDNRKPDSTSAQAWALALGDRRFEECQRAIVEHYQTSTEWIMPAHVIAAVKKVRTGRLEDVTTQPPPGLDPDDTGAYSRWLKSELRRVADGLPPTEQPYNATRAIGELRSVLRSVPAIEAKPREKSAEHEQRMAQARAELDAHPARREFAMPTAEPTHQEPTMPEPESQETADA